MRLIPLTVVVLVLLSVCVAKPAHSASLSLVITTDRQALNGALYSVADTVNFAGSVRNGSAVPDALVLFEVDTPKGTPWIIRTFATGQTPTGPWLVQLLSVTPSDAAGNPRYSFTPGQDAGFNVSLRNNALTPFPVVVTINLFFSNGLPFALQTLVNTTLQPGQPYSSWTWPINIPTNSVPGQAMVYASIFNDYPKNGGLPYSPEQTAAFNITSGVPAQSPQSGPPGTFNFTVSVTSIPTLPVWLGNYTAYAMTLNGYLIAAAQTMFTVELVGDMNADGKIDITDVATVAKAFGSHPGSPNWKLAADISGPIALVPDGRIDISDVAPVAREFGRLARSDP